MDIANRVEQVIEAIDNLPPFPEVARRTLELAGDPGTNAEDIFQVVQYDQAVTANCLKLCNSSYYGLQQKISSLRHAVALVGTRNLVEIVLAVSCGFSEYRRALPGYGFHPGELWRHSVQCAMVSQLTLKKLGRPEDPILFTASLLHDVGKLILDELVDESYDMIVPMMGKHRLSYVEAEKKILGIDHAEVGGQIARMWQFPESLVSAIRNHHDSLPTENEVDFDSMVDLSNLVAHIVGDYSNYGETMGLEIHQDILDLFGLGQSDIQDIVDAVPAEMERAEELLKIPLVNN